MPQAGSAVSFPSSFGSFGMEDCTGTPSQCALTNTGGVVEIRQESDAAAPAPVVVGKLQFPTKGKLRLVGNINIGFIKQPVNTSVNFTAASRWVDSAQRHRRDFKCGSNWVVQGTAINPNFDIPCYFDVAVFANVSLHFPLVHHFAHENLMQGHAYMVSVPSNTYLHGLDLPSGYPVTSDPYQFSGAALNVQASSCRDLFSNNTGVTYCNLVCLNTCPEQHPNVTKGLILQLQQNQTLLTAIAPAVADLNASFNALTSPVAMQSIWNVQAPALLSATALQTVANRSNEMFNVSLPFRSRFNVCIVS